MSLFLINDINSSPSFILIISSNCVDLCMLCNLKCIQGKKQVLRIESLAALEKIVRNVLSILGLMPASYTEVRMLVSGDYSPLHYMGVCHFFAFYKKLASIALPCLA